MPRTADVGLIGREVADNVKAARTKKGMSLRALAAELQKRNAPIGASQLLKLERGQRRVDVDELYALAGALDVRAVDLLGEKHPRPYVKIDPAMRFGYPQIRGISTEAIAGMVMAGEDVATVAYEYDLTVHEVLVGCWYEGLHGMYRKQWKRWAQEAHGVLWSSRGDIATIEPPPDERDIKGQP